MQLRTILKLSALLAIVGFSACSPYLYSTEIANFDKGTLALQAVADEQHTWQQEWREDRYRASLSRLYQTAEREGSLLPNADLTDDCALLGEVRSSTELREARNNPGATQCTIIVIAGVRHVDTPPSGDRLPEQILQANKTLAFDNAYYYVADHIAALRSYSQAITALTNSEDAKELQAAQGTLVASVGGLAASIGHPQEAAERNALGQGIANTVAIGLRYRLDQRRFSALRSAVRAAHPNLAALSGPIDQYLEQVHEARLGTEFTDLAELVEAANSQFREGPSEISEGEYVSQFVELDQAAQSFIAYANTSPKMAFEELVSAHGALSDALGDNSRQYVHAIAAATAFTNAIHDFETALAAFQPDEEEENGE